MRPKQKGFTLIELMVVLSVTAVLGTLGIAGFVNYNQVQTLQTSANDLATTLNVARSRALSQVKLGSTCNARVLEGYGVEISVVDNSYSLKIYCPRPIGEVLDTKTLPQNITFNSPNTSFFFPVLSGGVVQTPPPPGQSIVISGYGLSKTVIVNLLGGVSIQ